MLARKMAIAVVACLLTVLIGMAIIYSLNLFPRTIINRLSKPTISMARCYMVKSNLGREVSGARRLNAESVAHIMTGANDKFSTNDHDRLRIRFTQIGRFIGHEYGMFSRAYEEPVSRSYYVLMGSDICLFNNINNVINVMSYYESDDKYIFEVIYSTHDHKIFKRRI
jgi:hypothetical protein